MALPQEQDGRRNNPTQRIPADQRRSRSVDWRSKTDPQDPYTRTTSNTYEAEQQKRLTGEKLLDREAADRKKQERKERRSERIQKNIVQHGIDTNKNNPEAAMSALGAVANINGKPLKKTKIVRATWIAAGICFGLYYYQVAFWLLSMAGLGAEALLNLTPDGILATPLKWIVDMALPTEQLFTITYIICSTIALIQLFITTGIYFVNAINPFKGVGFFAIIFIFALSWMPLLGIVPWVYIWMYFVIQAHRT